MTDIVSVLREAQEYVDQFHGAKGLSDRIDDAVAALSASPAGEREEPAAYAVQVQLAVALDFIASVADMTLSASENCHQARRLIRDEARELHAKLAAGERDRTEAGEWARVTDEPGLRLIAESAAWNTFRHHPGAWTDALPAALLAYHDVLTDNTALATRPAPVTGKGRDEPPKFCMKCGAPKGTAGPCPKEGTYSGDLHQWAGEGITFPTDSGQGGEPTSAPAAPASADPTYRVPLWVRPEVAVSMARGYGVVLREGACSGSPLPELARAAQKAVQKLPAPATPDPDNKP